MNDYQKILEKIRKDQQNRPIICCPSPKAVTGPTGPTGPAGTSVNILGTYDTYQDLINEHPTGNINDSYLVNGDLYVWTANENDWKNVGRIMGPTGPQGEKGEKGDQGPIGQDGPTRIKSAYIVTFNDGTFKDGIPVASSSTLPLDRVELDTNTIITLNQATSTIKFNEIGTYKITFTVSAYPEVTGIDFDPTKDYVSIGFRQSQTEQIYIGVGEWVFNGEAQELYAQGIISVIDTTDTYELANLGKYTIFLNTPSIENIESISYFSNPLITIVIEYLGR